MNRRAFLGASAAAATLAAAPVAKATVARTRQSDRLKVLIPATMNADLVEDLKATAPGVDLVACRDQAEALEQIDDADATSGFGNAELIAKGQRLRWIQWNSAGVENIVFLPELQSSEIVLTNMQRVFGPPIADQAIGYLLAFTRQLEHFIQTKSQQQWMQRPYTIDFDELAGKTMLVVGLGGIGQEIARRAYGLGMTVLATDPKVLDCPRDVEELHRPDAIEKLLPRADVVVSAVPLTPESRQMFNASTFGLMKPGVLFVNVSRGGVTDTAALISALKSGHVAAAGLDVTDPEPLPAGHPLWDQNVIITPHSAGVSAGSDRRKHEVFKENLRRFSQGLMLLNVVDKQAGY
ncbi:D-2-hydroxyacid dehydrogenase [soil metagenome]